MGPFIFISVFVAAIACAATLLLRKRISLRFIPAGVFALLAIVFFIMSRTTQKPWADLGYLIYAMFSFIAAIPSFLLALFLSRKK